MNQKLLILGKVWVEPTSSAAGSRMLQLISIFKNNDWDITFATAANVSEFAINLTELEIEVAQIKINDSSFDEFIKNQDPDVVLFDRFMTEEQFGWRVAEQCPQTLRVLDTEDLHCLRSGRQKALKEERSFVESDLFSDHAKREIASIYRCDLSLIISTYEMEILEKVFNVDSELLHYVPFLLEPILEKETKKWIPFEDRTHFISIGNFLHEPNWDTVKYLKQKIWKRIRKELPKAELHIYGAYPSQKVFELNNPKEGFLVKGRAENVKDVMSKARICLAPIRFGGGLKGKLVDAMQNGTPSVTSSIGAEGMCEHLPWSGAIEDDPSRFINAAIELYTNQSKWKESQQNGAEIINSLFSKKVFEEELYTKIEETLSRLKEHRERNFVGAMLMHHTASGTKFMSKWIEEKNK